VFYRNVNELEKITGDFLFHCRVEKNLSSHTLKAYKLDLRQFDAYLSGKRKTMGIKEIDKHILRDYLRELEENNKIKTVKRKIATLKALFNYLEFDDIIGVNPFRKMRIKIKEPLQLPGVMTLDEIKTLFQAIYKVKNEYEDCEGYSYRSIVRDIVALELLFATGIRVSELCTLTKVNVNMEQRYIQVNGKGSRERVVQLCSPEIITIMEEYLRLFHPTGANFLYFFINRLGKRLSEQSVRFMIKKYVKLAGIDKPVTPHTFRHTFATLLLEGEVDIRYIQQLLGHSAITTTQIYTHITRRKQEEILTSRHPRCSFKLTEE
jgi:integrase/recombinase XerD